MKMNYLKKIFEPFLENQMKSKRVATPEMVEIGTITKKLIDRLDHKIDTLKALEARADQKIAILDGLITKYKNLGPSEDFLAGAPKTLPAEGDNQAPKGLRDEVESLAEKGFNTEQIARILDIPSGEVELILNLAH
jgi:hypothetical protein